MIHGCRTSLSGFMRLELLAVLTVTILLAGVWIPTGNRIRARSASLVCMNNHKQIINAWQMYAQANEGKCANNYTIPATISTITRAEFETWANNVMTWSAGSGLEDTSVTNEFWAAKGTLHSFTGGDVEIYRCPADRYVSAVQRQRGYQKRVRTMAMNGLIGPPEPSAERSERSWGFGGQYRQWLKAHKIPAPAKTWVTIDEHPDSVNDGFFINSLSASSWGDIPATLHRGSTTFSFADGHVETRKWRSSTSRYSVGFRYPNTRLFDA
jgi:prepilin-type processing-associated H-X9-DG protein